MLQMIPNGSVNVSDERGSGKSVALRLADTIAATGRFAG